MTTIVIVSNNENSPSTSNGNKENVIRMVLGIIIRITGAMVIIVPIMVIQV